MVVVTTTCNRCFVAHEKYWRVDDVGVIKMWRCDEDYALSPGQPYAGCQRDRDRSCYRLCESCARLNGVLW